MPTRTQRLMRLLKRKNEHEGKVKKWKKWRKNISRKKKKASSLIN